MGEEMILYASTVQVTHRQLPSRTFVGNKGGQLSSLTVDLFYLDTFSETREQNYKRSHGCVSHVLQCPIPCLPTLFLQHHGQTPRGTSLSVRWGTSAPRTGAAPAKRELSRVDFLCSYLTVSCSI